MFELFNPNLPVAGQRRSSAGRIGLVAVALAAVAAAAPAQERHGPDGNRADEHGARIERAPQPPRAAERPLHDGLGGRGRPADFGAPHLRYDNRFQAGANGGLREGRYFPARGFVSASLPPGALSVGYRGGRYYYQGGVWFRPYGPRFTVIAPPVGIVLPVLPLAYATLWFGGSPYYYANDVYYTPAPGGYRVVAPPPGIEAVQPDADDPAYRAPPSAPTTAAPPPPAPAPAPAPAPIFYPRNGQTTDQTEADRQQCSSWATTQPNAIADAGVFQRAVAACMDGRGYTVR